MTTDASDLVTYDLADGVAHVELNRPDAANALDLPLARALREAIDRVGADDDVRAVLVTGAGKRFCAGGDVSSFAAATDPATYLFELATEADGAMQALGGLTKPVVAAVQGAVAGAGVALMLSCDLVVADRDAKFVFAYPGVGLTPDCGVSYLLPRAVGQQRALAFALGGQALSAEEALSWGLITEVADASAVRAREWAATLGAGPGRALGQARRLLREGWRLSRSETGAEEARTISLMSQGDEARDMIARFLDR